MWILLAVFVEFIYQLWQLCHSQELGPHVWNHSMSVIEFKRRVHKQKEKLCILDNCVLDIGQFNYFHPGGQFTIEKNIGRDVTKYFNGAYKLVNTRSEIIYTHPATAFPIANSLVIATLEGQSETRPVKCHVVERRTINKTGCCYKFQSANMQIVPNWKHWHKDLSMIGRHYVIYSKRYGGHKRQYTVCNSIVPELY